MSKSSTSKFLKEVFDAGNLTAEKMILTIGNVPSIYVLYTPRGKSIVLLAKFATYEDKYIVYSIIPVFANTILNIVADTVVVVCVIIGLYPITPQRGRRYIFILSPSTSNPHFNCRQ